ncbi:hypothetical protein BH10ACT11_BH10ACT11_09880 [soil metagenome]
MPNSSPSQVILRDRVEGLISLVSPLLDGLLSVGDRVSRVVGREDEYYPVRPAGEAFELVPAVRPVLNADVEAERDASARTGDSE